MRKTKDEDGDEARRDFAYTHSAKSRLPTHNSFGAHPPALLNLPAPPLLSPSFNLAVNPTFTPLLLLRTAEEPELR